MNYIQQAYKGLNHWWRYLITILVVMSPFILNIVIYLLYPELFEIATEGSEHIDSNADFFVSVLTFGFFLGLLLLFIKFMHKRSITSLITSRKKIDWKRIFFAFFLWFFISLFMLVIGYFQAPELYIWNFKPQPFLILVLIAFFLMPLQTSFEELLFRGYLMQSIGFLLKNKWSTLIITSVLFGLMHGFNPEVTKLGPIIMVYYIGTGLFLGIITLMDEGTELALGFHAANNIVAAIFVAQTWSVLQTEALFLENSEPSIGFQAFLPVFILYPIVLFIFSKKYHWTDWSGKLFGKVEKPKETTNFFKEESFLEV